MLIDAALWFVLAAGHDGTREFSCPPEVILSVVEARPPAGWRVLRGQGPVPDGPRVSLRGIRIIDGEPVLDEPAATLVPDNVDRLDVETTARWELNANRDTWLACDYGALDLVRHVGKVRRCLIAHYVGHGARGRVECEAAD